MIGRLFRRDRHGDGIASALYGAIVAQARRPGFYAGMGVPDSVEGRFEMVVLHLVLLIRRLKLAGETAQAAGQGVFDLFCKDMDHSLRELGVGDLSVPKRMREVGEAYFGRAVAYEPGLLAANAEALAEAIGRTIFAGDGQPEAARALAVYSIEAAGCLKGQPDDAIMAKGPDFPQAGVFLVEGTIP